MRAPAARCLFTTADPASRPPTTPPLLQEADLRVARPLTRDAEASRVETVQVHLSAGAQAQVQWRADASAPADAAFSSARHLQPCVEQTRSHAGDTLASQGRPVIGAAALEAVCTARAIAATAGKPHDRAVAVRPMVERAAFALPGGRVIGSAREVAPSPVPDPRSEP